MNEQADRPQHFPLTLLLFSVGGINFGVDTGQVLGTSTQGSGTDPQEDAPLWFHRSMGSMGDPSYAEPTTILVKSTRQEGCRVVIDAMQEIIEVGVDEILPFPAVLEPFARRKGMWGVYPRLGHMFLLVDLERLANTNSACPD